MLKCYLEPFWKCSPLTHIPPTSSQRQSKLFTLLHSCGIIIIHILCEISFHAVCCASSHWEQGQKLYLLSVFLVPSTMPDPQWVVDITAVIYPSIILINHHAFNSLYLNPFCHVTNSVDFVLKRSIRKGTCGGNCDAPPGSPLQWRA